MQIEGTENQQSASQFNLDPEAEFEKFDQECEQTHESMGQLKRFYGDLIRGSVPIRVIVPLAERFPGCVSFQPSGNLLHNSPQGLI